MWYSLMMDKSTIFVLILLVLILGAAYWSTIAFPIINPRIQVCTEEAKICPDGTAVGRVGPNCEFAPCPVATTTVLGLPYEEEI